MKKMRNKRTAFLTFFLCALLAAFCLTAVACDFGNSSQKGGTKNGATVTGLDVTVKKEGLALDGDSITVEKGTVLALTKEDFTVKVLYSDGTSKTVTQYDLDASALEGELEVGTYTVTFKYNKQTKIITVNVVDDTQPETDFTVLPDLPSEEQMTFTYTGEEIDAIEKADEWMRSATTLSTLIEEHKVSVTYTEDASADETQRATEPGSYHFTLLAADGYGWNDVSENGAPAKATYRTVLWSIAKAVLVTPTIVRNELTYNGEEQTVEIDFHGQDANLFTFVNGGVDTRKATNVSGMNIVVVQLTESAQAHYALREFDGGLTSAAAVEVGTFSIVPAALPIPTVVGKQADSNGYYHYTYTGEAIIPQLSLGGAILEGDRNGAGQYAYAYGEEGAFEGVRVYIGASDLDTVNAAGTDADVHLITCEIDGNVEGVSNYYWQGTEYYSTAYIRFVIDKAEAYLPDDFAENFKLKYVYTGLADEIANWYLRIAPNYYLTLLDTGHYTFDSNVSIGTSNNFLLTEDVKAYLQSHGIAIHENVNLPTDEQYQPIGYQGNNLEFCWAEDASFGEDNVAQIGTYHFDLVYKQGLSDENQYIENYEPIVIHDVEVEVIKGAKVFYQINSPEVLRSDGQTFNTYSVDENGDPMTFTVRMYPYSEGSAMTIASYRHTYSMSEDPTTFEETNELINAGYYKTYAQVVYDSTRYNAVYDKGDGAYELTDTLEYDWRVWKQQFSINGGLEPNRSIKNGTIEAYEPGAHFWVSGWQDASGNLHGNYAVEVDFAFTQTFWYKATEEDEYTLLVPSEGKYNLFRNGYYKYVVSNFVYDTVNYEISSDDPVTYEWTQNREAFFLMLSDDFNKATGKFETTRDVGGDFRPYQVYYETISWLPAVSVVGNVTVEYKANEEDDYAVVNTYANTAEDDYPVTAAGYYRVTAAIDYDDASYYYAVDDEMDTTYTVTYEFVIEEE